MRTTILLTTALCLVLSSTAYAQMGGGGMGGMGGGGMGGGGGGGRGHGGGKGEAPSGNGEATPDARPAAAIIPVSMKLKGILTLAGVAKALKGGQITSDQQDVSGLYATRGSQLTIDSVDIITTAPSSLVSDSHDYGINSALLIDTGASVKMTGGKISTDGQGANAAYVNGDAAFLSLQGTTISTQGTGAYGIDIRAGAGLEATNVSIITGSDHAPALSIQTQGQPARVTGGSFTTQGPSSPAFALAGDIEASGVTASAARSNGLEITGRHHVSFTGSSISSTGYGVMIYEAPTVADASMPGMSMGGPQGGPPGGPPHGEHGGGDHAGKRGGGDGKSDKPKSAGMRPVTDMMAAPPPGGPDGPGLYFAGGKLSGHRAAIYVTNMRSRITLDGVELTSANGVILKAAADQWGELGRNGGDATLDARHQTLTGDFVTDVISHIAVNLSDNSHLTGKATHNTDVALDTTSTWTLTDDSSVGKLTADPAQINSQGHTLSYDQFRNPALNSQTIPLPGGGQLVPSGL